MPKATSTASTSTLAGAFYCEIKKVVQGDELDEGDGTTPSTACVGPRDTGKDGIFLNSNNFIKLFSRWIP
jgi:hypothetical protein